MRMRIAIIKSRAWRKISTLWDKILYKALETQNAWNRLYTHMSRLLPRKMQSLPLCKNRLVTVAQSSRNRSNSWTKRKPMPKTSAIPTSQRFHRKRHKSTNSKTALSRAARLSLISLKLVSDSFSKSPLSATKWVLNQGHSLKALDSHSESLIRTSR